MIYRQGKDAGVLGPWEQWQIQRPSLGPSMTIHFWGYPRAIEQFAMGQLPFFIGKSSKSKKAMASLANCKKLPEVHFEVGHPHSWALQV